MDRGIRANECKYLCDTAVWNGLIPVGASCVHSAWLLDLLHYLFQFFSPPLICLLQSFSFTKLFTYINVRTGLHFCYLLLDKPQSDKFGAFYFTVYYVYSSHWAKHRLVRKSNSYRVEREASRTCVVFAKINSLMSSNLPASSGRAD